MLFEICLQRIGIQIQSSTLQPLHRVKIYASSFVLPEAQRHLGIAKIR